jgi:ATP-dependent helicase/DNAse subunit B
VARKQIKAAEAWLQKAGYGEKLAAARRERVEPDLAAAPALGAHIAPMRRFSASRLESYAECPYRFLMASVLNLEEEEGYEPGALEEGRYYHKVLQLFYTEWDKRCDLSEAELNARLAALHEQAIAALAEQDDEPVFLSPRFRAETTRRLRILREFLRRDLERLRETNFGPDEKWLEKGFVLDSSQLPGRPGSASFQVSGYVDRVDRGPGNESLVLDYKRSKKETEAVDEAAPRLFQLALYALAQCGDARGAAYYALPDAKPLRGYFQQSLQATHTPWIVGGAKGSSRGGHWLDPAAWDQWLADKSLQMGELVDRIRRGELAAAPAEGEDSCRYCPFKQLCRWRPDEARGEGGGK